MPLKIVAALSVVFALSSVAAPAQACEGDAQVCVLNSTLVRTSPKKAPAVITKLDCGAKPDEDQTRLIDEVNNAQNVADALEAVAHGGYKVTGVSVRESYTGHEVYGVYTLLKECCGGCKMEEGEHADAEDEDEDGDEPATPATPEVPKAGEDL